MGVKFLALPVLFAPYPSSPFDALRNPPCQRDMIAYMLVLGFFCLNYFLLIPKLYFAEKYSANFAIVPGCLVQVILLPEFITHHHFGDHPPPEFAPDHPPGAGPPPKHQVTANLCADLSLYHRDVCTLPWYRRLPAFGEGGACLPGAQSVLETCP